jgi:hypothetical protein
MQTNNLVPNQLPTSANSGSLGSTTNQQSGPDQLENDPELLKLIDDLVLEIKKCANNALTWRILIGVRLREYRDGLESDDWSQVLRSGRLPFAARTAQMLVRIGEHRLLADKRRVHQLPDSITVLNEIAALPHFFAERALSDGRIHPGTTLAEAKTLVAEVRAKKLTVPAQTSIP